MGATVPRKDGNVRSLHPVRVLLVGGDPRFLRAATFLLERERFEVIAVCGPDQAVSLAGDTRPHAVVVDGTESVAVAGRTALAIEASGLPVRVLVVAPGGARRWTPLAQTTECGSFPELTYELGRLFGTRPNGRA